MFDFWGYRRRYNEAKAENEKKNSQIIKLRSDLEHAIDILIPFWKNLYDKCQQDYEKQRASHYQETQEKDRQIYDLGVEIQRLRFSEESANKTLTEVQSSLIKANEVIERLSPYDSPTTSNMGGLVEQLLLKLSKDAKPADKGKVGKEIEDAIYGVLAPEVNIAKVLPASELKSEIQKILPDAVIERMYDDTYYVATLESFAKALVFSWVSEIQYRSNIGDCDVFARELQVEMSRRFGYNACIYAESVPHAFNLCCLWYKDQIVWKVLEPQQDHYVEYPWSVKNEVPAMYKIYRLCP